MISHEHKCIFIHIPKCGGTSIEEALGHNDGYSGANAQDHRTIRQIERPAPFFRTLPPVEHVLALRRRARDLMLGKPRQNPASGWKVSRAQYQRYFKFTIVRNPWARVYSWYQNALRDGSHRRRDGLTEDLSLAEFVDLQAGKGMLAPQFHWIRAADGSIPLDFIGRFETLEHDFAHVCQRLGIVRTLPHRLKGAGGDFRAAYDEPTKQRVAEAYREEIEWFGYTFER